MNLRVDTDATEDRERGERQVRSRRCHAFLDLHGEFARRREDQHARLLRPCALALQKLQDGQREAGGLSGAGLRAGHQVALLQHDGNRLLLDRGRCRRPARQWRAGSRPRGPGSVNFMVMLRNDGGRLRALGASVGTAKSRRGDHEGRRGHAATDGLHGRTLDEGAQSSTRHSCHEEINISYRLFASANFRG